MTWRNYTGKLAKRGFQGCDQIFQGDQIKQRFDKKIHDCDQIFQSCDQIFQYDKKQILDKIFHGDQIKQRVDQILEGCDQIFRVIK